MHRTFTIVVVLCMNLHGRDLPCLTGVVAQKMNRLNLPDSGTLKGTSTSCKFHFIGDDAFRTDDEAVPTSAV